jgi:DNA-binding XRE family transcriptional regulator
LYDIFTFGPSPLVEFGSYNIYGIIQSVNHNIYVIVDVMNEYEETVKRLQAQAAADIQALLNRPLPDRSRNERVAFLITLIRARQHQNLSQAALAERLGLQQPAIARIESGRGNPSLNTLLAIARELDVTLVLE